MFYNLPDLFHVGTELHVWATPAVPARPAAHLGGEALLEAGLEVIVRVQVAGVLRQVQLLNKFFLWNRFNLA